MNMNPRICILTAALAALVSLARAEDPPQPSTPPPQPKPEHTQDTPEMVKNNLELKKAVLVDVREEEEWDEGRLAPARLVPLSKIREGLKPDALPRDKIIYLHCRSGGRSLIAQELLKKVGYDVRALKQGYRDLLKAGFEKAE